MRWIVQSKDAAENAGADIRNDEAMYVITPTSVGEVFNSHMASDDLSGNWSCANPPDYWEKLTDVDQDEYLEAVWDYIEKQAPSVDEALRIVFDKVQVRMERHQKAGAGAPAEPPPGL